MLMSQCVDNRIVTLCDKFSVMFCNRQLANWSLIVVI